MAEAAMTQTETVPESMSGSLRESMTESEAQHKRPSKGSRLLTKQYRTLHYKIKSKGEDLADPTASNQLEDALNELNTLNKQVERPSEQADDSEAFHELTVRGCEMSKRVAAGKGRTINDFLRHLKVKFVAGENAQDQGSEDPRAFNWERLGRETSMFFFQVPGASCLLGPLDQLPKAKRQVVRQVRKPVGKAIAPTELTAEDNEKEEKRETEKNMEEMYSRLVKFPEGLSFLEVTMNVNSFAQFAENCFTLSFLVRDKWAKIGRHSVSHKRVRVAKSDERNSKGLWVWPLKKTDPNDNTQDPAKERAQMAMAYDMQDWNTWKNYVQPENCMMPHRLEDFGVQPPETQAGTQENTAPGPSAPVTLLDSETDEEDAIPIGSRKRKSTGGPKNDKKVQKAKGRHRLSVAS